MGFDPRVPGYIPGNLTIIDFSGAATAWIETSRQADQNGVISGSGSGVVESYAVGGDQPVPIESSLEGNPSANYQYVTTTTVQLGGRALVIANYDGSLQGHNEFGRIQQAIEYINLIYSSLSSFTKDDLRNLNAIFYTGGPGRSGVDLTAGILTFSAADMVGRNGFGGYMTLSVADRIIHDAHHITQYKNGDYAGVSDYSTASQIDQGVALERAAIQATLQAAELLEQLPAAQGTNYSRTVNDLRDYIDQSRPNYAGHQQRLRDRLQQPFARRDNDGGGGKGGSVDNTNN